MSAPPLSAIGEHVDPVSSWTPERDDPDGAFTYVDLSAVDQDAKVVSGERELACSEAPSRARQLIRAGDVLVSTVRPNLNGVALVPPELDGATASTGFCVLRPRAGQLDARYLYHWVKSPRFVSAMVRKATGASYPAVSDRIVCESRLPLPPLPEQRRIAEILDKADALRAKRRAALAQLDTLTQSIFLDMFGRPNDNAKGWPLVFLMDLCSPKQWPTISTAELTEAGFPVFGANGLIGTYTKYNHEEPTVLITCRGATCGTINVSPPKCYVTGNAMALDDPDPSRITVDYLATVLRVRSMADTISGTAQPQITRQSLAHVKLPLPPLALQAEFARRIGAVEQVKSPQQVSRAQLEALFASLQHRAFRGELTAGDNARTALVGADASC
ncbi:MAG: restriction endonuclease subunit S [Burkholderiales bacterium]|nr:restriction endonuclease subunit S [Burkholderiales bacterium]